MMLTAPAKVPHTIPPGRAHLWAPLGWGRGLLCTITVGDVTRCGQAGTMLP